ncbi:MAG: alpha/beta hydrolase [Thaumarchaeota archaeon]|nr:alpha/beta hydrolase [Nitrososphaerota archaeon]
MEATETQVEVGEFRLNLGSAGNGESLLLLHGSEPGEDWKVWEPMLPLADTYRVVAPDLVGFGKSSKQAETPDYQQQARSVRDLVEKLALGRAAIVGGGWGGQVALEYALEWPDEVKAVVLIASSYDKEQLRRLQKLRRPTLIVYAEDDMVTQLKAGYLLRDAIGTSRLEVLDSVAKDPRYDFRISHRLQKFRAPRVLQLVRLFLSNPEAMVAEPPELENELKGMALRKEVEGKEGPSTSEKP